MRRSLLTKRTPQENDKKNNSEEALKFYNESIELETDNIKKARILYKIATKFKNTKQSAAKISYYGSEIQIRV